MSEAFESLMKYCSQYILQAMERLIFLLPPSAPPNGSMCLSQSLNVSASLSPEQGMRLMDDGERYF